MQFSSYDQELSDVQSNEITDALALRHLDQSGPLGEVLRPLVAAKDYLALSRWSVDYSVNATADQFYHVRSALGCYQKHAGLRLGIDTKAVAYATFQESERRCQQSNEIFDLRERGLFSFSPLVESILHASAIKIANVLGPVPRLEELKLTFGPGATTTVPKRNACASMKLGAVPSCSANMLQVLPQYLREMPHMRPYSSQWSIDPEGWLVEKVSVEIHPGLLQFAPKNAQTDRAIINQPTLNGMAQRGYGLYMEHRLEHIGQSVHDQTRNQKLARIGSLTNGIATVDSKSASDSISIGLMRDQLPWDWFSTLSDIRVPNVQYKGKTVKLQQFCSMGNGFTFPLQTLLFWALTKSCCEHPLSKPKGELLEAYDTRISVYGDDIICTPACRPLLEEVFRAIGFVINDKKTYWTGRFRESCGTDYYFGTNIRPFYHRRNFSCETAFQLHNYYVRNYQNDFAEQVLETIAPEVRLWGPEGYGDGHLITSNSDQWAKPHNRERGWSGYTFETYAWNDKKLRKALMPGDFIIPVYSIYQRDKQAGGAVRVDREHMSALLIEPASVYTYTRPRKGSKMSDAQLEQLPLVKTIPGRNGFRKVKVYVLAV